MSKTVTNSGCTFEIVPYRFGRTEKVYDIYLKEGDNWPFNHELIKLCNSGFHAENGAKVEDGYGSRHKVVTVNM